MALCLVYCGLMSTVTMTYGIKFALRAEEAKRQLNDIPGDIDITYFNETNSTNLSNGSVSTTTRLMMNFSLNGTTALARDFITETELAAAHQVSVEELYTNISTEELKELYANSGIELVRPVVEEREDAYAGDSGRFLATSFLGLLIDVLIMQPGRVLVVAIIMVILTDQVDTMIILPSALCPLPSFPHGHPYRPGRPMREMPGRS